MSTNSRDWVNLAAARILATAAAFEMSRASPLNRMKRSALPLIGTVIAASTPMMATTIIISISEKPRSEAVRGWNLNSIGARAKGKRCAAGRFPMGVRLSPVPLAGILLHPGTRGYRTVSVRGALRGTSAARASRLGAVDARKARPRGRASRARGDGPCLGLQVLVHKLGHLEHVDDGLTAEHGLEVLVGLDVPPVLGVLQLVLLDVGPQLLGDFGPRNRLAADHFRQRRTRRHRFHECRVRLACRGLLRRLLGHLCSLIEPGASPRRTPYTLARGALCFPLRSCGSLAALVSLSRGVRVNARRVAQLHAFSRGEMRVFHRREPYLIVMIAAPAFAAAA